MSRLVYADRPRRRLRLQSPRAPREIRIDELRRHRLSLREDDAPRRPRSRGRAQPPDEWPRPPRERPEPSRGPVTPSGESVTPSGEPVTLLPARPRLSRERSAPVARGRSAGPRRSAGRLVAAPFVALGRSLRAVGVLRGAAIVLCVAGVTLLADAALTLVWKEPLSSLYAEVRQDQLSGELATLERALPTPLEVTALSRLRSEPARLAYLARALHDSARPGSAVGRIRIPRIDLDMVVVNGVDLADLREGPGIYPQTGFPGMAGTTAIAGHRTTYLAPFRHIDRLRPGDEISVDMPYGRFVYRVTTTRVVRPTDVAVLDRVGYDQLVLSACTPLYSAAERLIVFARLQRVDPLGPARVA